MSEVVSNEVIVERIEGFKALFNERNDENKKELKEIKIQTTKTNGDVRRLKIWRAYLTGFFVATSIIGGFVLKYMMSRQDAYQIQQDSHIQQLIDKAVSGNNDKYFDK